MPKVHFVVESRTVEVPRGHTIRAAARSIGLCLYTGLARVSHCGGRGLCAKCRVHVSPPTAVTPMWTWEELRIGVGDVRLACQTEVLDDVHVITGVR